MCQHTLSSPTGSSKQCVFDIVIQQKDQLQYHGLFAGLLKADTHLFGKTYVLRLLQLQIKNEGLGDVLAFIAAHEEQSRHTLHSHWRVFSKQLSTETQNLLFSEDTNEKLEANKFPWSRRSSHRFILWCQTYFHVPIIL